MKLRLLAVCLSTLSALWLLAYIGAVLPLSHVGAFEGFGFFTYPEVTFFRAWQHASGTFGPLTVAPFLVAGFPTGEATVAARCPAWPIALAAIIYLVYRVIRLSIWLSVFQRSYATSHPSKRNA